MYKVLMFGGREFGNPVPIKRELRKLVRKHGVRNLLVIAGGAPGADQLCEFWAKQASVHVARVDALWDTRRKAAGPQRNAVMAALEPDEGIGFHEDIASSRGTADMRAKLNKAGIPNRIITR